MIRSFGFCPKNHTSLVKGPSSSVLRLTEGRQAYLLVAENLQRGLDADLHEAKPEEIVRRFGEGVKAR